MYSATLNITIDLSMDSSSFPLIRVFPKAQFPIDYLLFDIEQHLTYLGHHLCFIGSIRPGTMDVICNIIQLDIIRMWYWIRSNNSLPFPSLENCLQIFFITKCTFV